jgi:hypothetical protein
LIMYIKYSLPLLSQINYSKGRVYTEKDRNQQISISLSKARFLFLPLLNLFKIPKS